MNPTTQILNDKNTLAEIVRVTKDEHRYYKRAAEPDAYLRPSATHVLSYWTPPYLKRWMIANSKKDIDKRLETTSKLGSEGHSAIELNTKGLEYEKTPENVSFVERYQSLVLQYQIKPLAHEYMVVSDLFPIGGQIDHFCELTDNKGIRKKYILDVKTGSSDSAGIQLGAYWLAHREMFEDAPGIACAAVHRDGRAAKMIFYHDPWFWAEQFVGLLPKWRSDNYQNLKAVGWNWLVGNTNGDLLGNLVDLKRKDKQ